MTPAWAKGHGRPLLLALGVVALVVAIGLPVSLWLARPTGSPLPLSTVVAVALPGQASRFDYADLDPAAHRLFIAHMGDGTLLELDTATNAVIATVPDLPSVTGVIVVPELHRVFASAAGAGQAVTIDEDTATVLARAPAGRFPDGLAYVPSTGQVWVSDEDGGAETALDARTGQPVATVPLGGQAGNVRYDPTGDRVLVDVQTADQIAVIDPHNRTILDRPPVPECDHDHGLLLAGGRAFVACDGNNALVTLTLPALTELGRLDVGDGPDVLAVDAGRSLLYVAAESGVVTTVDLRPTAGAVTGRTHLADNAHVVAVDPSTGRAYFPVPDTGAGHPGLLITTPGKRAAMILVTSAGTFGTGHIAVTAAITGALALAAAAWRLPRRMLIDWLTVAVLSFAAVLLWRLSANMPQLNDDGLNGFSANDWLAPVLTYVALSVYADLRAPAEPRRFAQTRALATVAALAVNVLTI